MSRVRRYYENTFEDLSPEGGTIIDSTTNLLSPGLMTEVVNIYENLLGVLEKNLSTETSDSSVYTGNAGLAYLYLRLGEIENDRNKLEKGIAFAKLSLKKLRLKSVTFLCGDSGPLSIAAALHMRVGNTAEAGEFVSRVLKMAPDVTNLSDLPDELLYGRVGYLFSLLFIQKYFPDAIDPNLLKQVVRKVIHSGRKLSLAQQFPAPLLWEWYDELYVGGAHGLAGILYLLLQVKHVLDVEQLQLIRQTVDYLLTIRFPSGNFPSSIGSSDDRLVHWCHGAPGVVQLMLEAYQTWGDAVYLDAAKKCGEVVWRRGLLRKGYGICHGVAGNAYTFLALFQVTKEEFQLYRAVQFARWCSSYNRNQDRPPDRPLSLFEGLAGTIYFLKDIQSPLDAVFPAFSTTSFKPCQQR